MHMVNISSIIHSYKSNKKMLFPYLDDSFSRLRRRKLKSESDEERVS